MSEFTTESIFEALRGPLGVIDSPERRKQIEEYLEAARVSVERSVFDLLSRFAEEVNEAAGAHYEVSLAYRPGVLDLSIRAREPAEATEEAWSMAEGDVEKITLRIPAELKELAAEAASRGGLSANAWFVRMLARALRAMESQEPPPRRRGRHGWHGPGGRLSGWVGPEE